MTDETPSGEIPDSLRPLLENRGDRPLPPWLLDQLLADGSQPIPVVFEPAPTSSPEEGRPIVAYVDPASGTEYDADGWPLVPISPEGISEDGIRTWGFPSRKRRRSLRGPRRDVGELVRITSPAHRDPP